MHDQLFTTPLDKHARFSFDEKVVACFPDMIRRSVPGYGQILAMITLLAKKQCDIYQKPIHIIDLGCSLGAVGLAIASQLTPKQFSMQAVDLSEPMTVKASETFKEAYPQHDIRVIQDDITQFELPECQMVVLNFTLQFIEPKQRLALIQKIYHALSDQGILVISEKFQAEDKSKNAWLIEQHESFKMANGYSELEVSQKRSALEHVLVRETLSAHHQRFKSVGFQESHTWFQYLNFASMVAKKVAKKIDA